MSVYATVLFQNTVDFMRSVVIQEPVASVIGLELDVLGKKVYVQGVHPSRLILTLSVHPIVNVQLVSPCTHFRTNIVISDIIPFKKMMKDGKDILFVLSSGGLSVMHTHQATPSIHLPSTTFSQQSYDAAVLYERIQSWNECNIPLCSAEFHRMVRDLSIVGDGGEVSICFKHLSKELVFQSSGEVGDVTFSLFPSVIQYSGCSDIVNVYSLTHINLAIKNIVNSVKNIHVVLSMNGPLGIFSEQSWICFFPVTAHR